MAGLLGPGHRHRPLGRVSACGREPGGRIFGQRDANPVDHRRPGVCPPATRPWGTRTGQGSDAQGSPCATDSGR
jgi:hypothetical protein